MSSVMGIAPTGFQSTIGVFGLNADIKPPPQTRDDYVAAVETTNNQAAKSDVSLLKMHDTSIGQTVDVKA